MSDAVDRFTGTLIVLAVGVYALVLLGATSAVNDAALACQSWPTCTGGPLDSPSLAIVWGHRLTAAFVGVVVLIATAMAWHREESSGIRYAIGAALLAYPVQVWLGAISVKPGTTALLSGLHLGIGIGIFSAIIASLAWALWDRTATKSEANDDEFSRRDGVSTLPEGPIGTALAYFKLMKPRLMWLLCLVASASMALAGGPALTVDTVLLTLVGGVLAIGASGTFNHVFERDVDRKMARTQDRPVVQDRIPASRAIGWGLFLLIASLVVFLQVNVLAAALGLAAILYYSVVYTLLLKPNTVQNTVIGGVAGALPALIGSAAVTGTIGAPGLLLAMVIFCWTPAHFYNLALAYREDYARGNFPMLPVVKGTAITRKHVVYYLGATLITTIILAWVTTLGFLFTFVAIAFGTIFLVAAVRLHDER
ncbi:MAG: heme o synthase, partial [Halobacteriaceae archaeon]